MFGTQAQEAVLEGHVHAFETFGGVPVEHIRYDNLKAAVARLLRRPCEDAGRRVWARYSPA